jgi:hypothetical protein
MVSRLAFDGTELFRSANATAATWSLVEDGEFLVTDGPATKLVTLGKRTFDVKAGRQSFRGEK